MNLLQVIYLLTGAVVCIVLEILAVTSGRENQSGAAGMSSTLLIIFALIWFGSYFIFSPGDTILLTAIVIILGTVVLFFAPLGSTSYLKATAVSERVDERDTLFAREEYRPGTEKFEKYYAAHPEHKATDDKIRALPKLLAPGGKYYDPDLSPRIQKVFNKIKEMTTKVDGAVSQNKQNADPDEMTSAIKEKLRQMGADEVGVAKLNPMWVYSFVGRGPEPWGDPIFNDHKFAIVFSLEMNFHAVNAAPDLPITEEAAIRYYDAAKISTGLAAHIRNLGYPARAHLSDSNYQIMLPPVAVDAGIGELGRHGYIISPRFGARIRLGAVTTDLPLVADRPIKFGVQEFCARCLKCSRNCPAGAITAGEKTDVRGVKKWKLDEEKCLQYWRAIGTDCGLCMKVCPFSHPPTFIHNLVRTGIRRSAFARVVSVWGDDLFYGKKAAH